MSGTQQDTQQERFSIEELDARWDQALETAPPAVIRGYYESIKDTHRNVFLYGVLRVSAFFRVPVDEIVAIMEDEKLVRALAEERGIDIKTPVTDGEIEEYREFYGKVYADVPQVQEHLRQITEIAALRKAMAESSPAPQSGHLDA